MMKFKKHFLDLIKNGFKTIEFRKIEWLQYITNLHTQCIDKKSRITIPVNNEDGEIIGKLTINGYSTIPNYFNELDKKSGSKNPSYQKEFLTNAFKKFGKINIKWIFDNLNWLTQYFKYQPEILVLNIEKFEKKEQVKLTRKEGQICQ